MEESALVGSYEWVDERGSVHQLDLRRVRGGLQTWYRAPGPGAKGAPRRAAAPGTMPLVAPLELLTWLALRIWEETSRDAGEPIVQTFNLAGDPVEKPRA